MILLAKLANSLRINEGIKVCYFTKDLNAKIKVCVQKAFHIHMQKALSSLSIVTMKPHA